MSQAISVDSPQEPLIDRFLSRLKRIKGEDHATYRSYRRTLRSFDDWLDGRDATAVTTLDLEDYLLHLKDEGYAASSIEAKYAAIMKLYRTAVEKYEAIDEDDNPCDGVDLDDLELKQEDADKVYYLTEDEKQQMVEAIPEKNEVRDRLIVELFWQTGVRKNELRNIKVEDVDRAEHRIHIYGEKTDTNRTVHYQPSLDRWLDLWLDVERPLMWDSEYLFPSNRAEQISKTELRRIIGRAAKPINEEVGEGQDGRTLYKITPHTLRHSHAVHALKSGVNVRAVQMQMGHSNIEMTMNYLRLVEDDVSAEYRAFE